MSKRRRRWNGICSDLCKPEVIEYRAADKRTREQKVVEIVTEECGRYSLSTMDDLASNIIVKLWEDEQFREEIDDVRAYVRGCVRNELRKRNREMPASQMERPEQDFDGENILERLGASTAACQHTRAMALEAYYLTLALPTDQCRALHILAGGGSPIDVAREMVMEPWDAIRLIKEARLNLFRVDPLDDAA